MELEFTSFLKTFKKQKKTGSSFKGCAPISKQNRDWQSSYNAYQGEVNMNNRIETLSWCHFNCNIGISHMKIAPANLVSIRAFFILTIGPIRMKNYRLTQNSTTKKFNISSDANQYINKNNKVQYEPLVKIFDERLKAKILKLALKEYESIRSNADVNSCE